MERIFYFFIKEAKSGNVRDLPIYSDEFLGDIGDPIIYNEELYIIVDYIVDYLTYDKEM